MKVLSTNLESKKDAINAGNAMGVMKDYTGVSLIMTGFVIYEDTKDDGTVQVVTSIKTQDGFIGSTSANVRSTVEMIEAEYMPDEIKAGIPFTIRSSESKNGRKFLTLELL